MPYRRITSSDRAAALQLKPTGLIILRPLFRNPCLYRPHQSMQRLGAFICATARHCYSAFFTLLEMRHPRYQLIANVIIDEAFLQAGAIRCSSGFGACKRLRFTAALGFLIYSGILKEVTGPVNLFGA
jgi:hypothetical protein